jgi:hypothetical protein
MDYLGDAAKKENENKSKEVKGLASFCQLLGFLKV